MVAGLVADRPAGPGRRRADARHPRRPTRASSTRPTRPSCGPGAAARSASSDVRFGYCATRAACSTGFDLHVAAGRDGRARRRQRLGQVDRRRCCCPASTTWSAGAGDRRRPRRARRHASTRCAGQVGMVFEEAFLFSDSDPRQHRLRPPRRHRAEEIVAAARAPRSADEFIAALPAGLRHRRRRARASRCRAGSASASRSPARCSPTRAMLVLDDATSSIDPRPRQQIHDDAAARSCAGAHDDPHRPPPLDAAPGRPDRACSTPAGSSTTGTHDELVAACAAYRELFARPGPGHRDATRRCRQSTASTSRTTSSRTRRRGRTARSASGAWPRPCAVPTTAGASPAAARSGGAGGGGGGGGGHGRRASPATPQLLAALAAAAAGDDDPRLDVDGRGRPRRRRGSRSATSCARSGAGLAIGLGLVVASTRCLTLLGPVLRPAGHRPRRAPPRPGGAVAGVADVPRRRLGRLVRDLRLHVVSPGAPAERMLYALRVRIFAHLQRLALDYYDREMAGRIMTRMTTDVEALSQLVQTGLITAIVSSLTCVGVLVVLVVLDRRRWRSPSARRCRRSLIATCGTAAGPPQPTPTRGNGSPRSTPTSRRASPACGSPRPTAARTATSSAFRARQRRLPRRPPRRQKLIALYFPFVLLSSPTCGSAIVLGAGGRLVEQRRDHHRGRSSPSCSTSTSSSPRSSSCRRCSTPGSRPRSSMEQISELLRHARRARRRPPTRAVRAALRGADRASTTSHFALRRHRRRRGAGRRRPDDRARRDGGAGRRDRRGQVDDGQAGRPVLRPDGGQRCCVDGIDLRDLDLAGYRHQLGVVPQEAFLFTGTVRDNIAYGRPDATDAEVEAAARAVGAHEMIAPLPRRLPPRR